MTASFVVVSFYTKGTYYEEEIKSLIASCERHNIEIKAEGIENKGSWNQNCDIKTFFILESLKRHNKPSLWIDADAIVCQPLDYFDSLKADFAVRIQEDLKEDDPSKVISATIYAKLSSLPLIEKWCALSEKEKHHLTDQECLRDAILAFKDTLFIQSLPSSFCSIIDLEKDQLASSSPIIAQTQASRLYGKIIDGEVEDFPFLSHLTHEELKKVRHPHLDLPFRLQRNRDKGEAQIILDLFSFRKSTFNPLWIYFSIQSLHKRDKAIVEMYSLCFIFAICR